MSSHALRSPARTIVAALGVVLVIVAAADLGDARLVTGDDAIILRISAHLAEHGELGSPLHRGFHGAGEHWFLNLPFAHVLHAAVFRVAGVGIAQARAVSVAGALLVFVCATVLAWRWAGPRAAMITALLLVLWRSGLAGHAIPLIGSARTVRYDVLAVGLSWLALLLLDAHLREPRARTAVATGAVAAAACLTQFHGAFVLPALVAGWILWHPRERRWRHAAAAAIAGIVVILPYALHSAAHVADAVAQFGAAHSARMDAGAAALAGNLIGEPRRWLGALARMGAGPLLVLAILPAFAVLAVRLRRDEERVRMLLLATASFLLPLALLEQTKAPLYALPLVPAICIAFAFLLDRMLGARTAWGSLPQILALVLLCAVAAEGAATAALDLRRIRTITPYGDLVSAIDAALPAGAGVAGAARFAWGLRARPYVELRALSLTTDAGNVAGAMRAAAGFVLIDDDVRAAMQQPEFYGAEFIDGWQDFVELCTTQERTLEDATRGRIEIRAIRAPGSDGCRL